MSWIKLEVGTQDKVEILGMAQECGCSQDTAFASWNRFMCWADAITADGFIERLTPDFTDRIARLSGFGKAMVTVGWLTFSPEGATIANWKRHNGKSAKRRANNAERMASKRASENCAHSVRKKLQHVRKHGGSLAEKLAVEAEQNGEKPGIEPTNANATGYES